MPARGGVAKASAMVLVVASYIACAQIPVSAGVGYAWPSLLWAPNGIALAAILLFGPVIAIAIGVGVAAAILSIGGHPVAVITVALLDTLEALAAFYALRKLRFHYALYRVRDVFALVGVAIVVTLLAASAGAGMLFATGVQLRSDIETLWSSWWWSHLAGDLIVAPLFLTWSARGRLRELGTARQVIELAALAALVVVLGLLVFGEWMPFWLPGGATRTYPSYFIPLFMWAALRFGPRIAATVNVLVSAFAIGGILRGTGPFAELADFQAFVSISSVASLALAALHVEVGRAIRRKSAIQQAALDAIVTIDAADRIVELNPAAERLFRVRLHDALGTDVKQLFVPESLVERLQGKTLASYVREHGESLIGKRVQSLAKRADGSEFPAEIGIMRPMPDGEDLFSASIRDISMEQQAELTRLQAQRLLEETVRERTKELARKEELLRDAQTLAHLGSFEFHLGTGELAWSEELYRIFGRDPATFRPTYGEFLQAIVPGDRQMVQQAIQGAIRDSTTFDCEERIVRPDGTVRALQSQGKVVLDEDGKPARIIGCCQDVTERKLAEAARYRLVDLVESSQDAIIGLTVDGIVDSWNAAAQKLFGYTADEIVGQRAEVLVPPELVPEVERMLASVRAGQDLSHYEMVQRRKDGTEFEASVTMSAIVDHEKHVIGISKVLRDISDQKRARKLIEQSLREKEVLLREIHHRVKNNLQVISSLLNLQVASVRSETARKGLVESQSRIQSMALLHQLLYQSADLAHIEIGAYLRALVEYLVSTYSGDAIRITTTVVAPELHLDIDRSIPCGLIVNELVTNCYLHAFPDGRSGHIWIEVSMPDDDHVAIEVRDDGVGMPIGVEADTAPTFGLQIARLLAAQLDGSLEILRGGGTTVRTVFPCTPRRESSSDVRAVAGAERAAGAP